MSPDFFGNDMVISKAKTVTEYLESLSEEQLGIIAPVHRMLLGKLPKGVVEVMNWGMICYQIPFTLVPKTYNGQPLMFAALAAQKNYCSLYMMSVYQNQKLLADLQAGFEKAGKKLNMGKSCLRFKKLEDLHLPTLAKVIQKQSLKKFIDCSLALASPGSAASKKKASGKQCK